MNPEADDPIAGSLFALESAVFAGGSAGGGVREALATRNALAVAYCGGERYTEAADMLREVVEQCTERLGADDPDTLVAAGNLGVALAWLGRFDDALPLLSHVLAARERVLGDEHLDTLTARDALAVTYRLAGQVAAAVGLHAHVVEQRIRVLGPAHPHTLTSRCGLALARIAAGSAGAAANVLSAALVDAEEVPGPPTLATVVLRANLGRCLLQLERPALGPAAAGAGAGRLHGAARRQPPRQRHAARRAGPDRRQPGPGVVLLADARCPRTASMIQDVVTPQIAPGRGRGLGRTGPVVEGPGPGGAGRSPRPEVDHAPEALHA